MRLLVTLLAACALAQADTVFLKDGTKVEGKIVGSVSGRLGIKTAEGKMVWIEEATIERIEKEGAAVPPEEPSTPSEAASPPPADPPKDAPKCPNCKGKKTVKCTSCTDGMADVPCAQCSGNGFVACTSCKGAGRLPCSCGGKDPKCKTCSGSGLGEDCPACMSGATNCPGCNGARMVHGPCPICKKKRKAPCPVCQGTGLDPNPPGDGTTPPADPAAEPPSVVQEPEAPPTEEPAEEAPAVEPAKPKMPACALSSPVVEVVFGVVDGLKRTEGKKLWKVTVNVTNGEELGSLIVKCSDFTLKTDDGGEVKALTPERGHPDAAPRMIGKAASKEVRLYFETAYDRTPKSISYMPPKWKGEPFSIDLPKPK